jgi:UDP-N-acetylbacillosamine N-acetyltransferase
MTKRIYVYGASGHGKSVADILLCNENTNLVGFVDDQQELTGTKVLGLPVVGNGDWLEDEARRSHVAVALGIGNNRIRQLIAARCSRCAIEIVTLVHPCAVLSRSAQLGRGTVVMASAVVNSDAKIGEGVIVNSGAVVEHDVVINDYAHIAPNAAMGGASRLGYLSQLGLGSVVLQCVTVGSHTMIGAGAVVLQNIPDQVVAFGVPARIHRRLEEEISLPCKIKTVRAS